MIRIYSCVSEKAPAWREEGSRSPIPAEELLAGDSFCERDSPFPPLGLFMFHKTWAISSLYSWLSMFPRIFFGFGMLTVLGSTGQVFYRMSLSWDLLDTFLIITWKLLVLGEGSRNSDGYSQDDLSVSVNLDYLT